MTPAQWQRVRGMFEALVDCDPAEARRRLDAGASDDPDVKAEVASLLAHHSRAGSFLDVPPALDPFASAELAPGTRLGAYSLVREIGRGGMGRVYLATDNQLQRQVCLKAVHHEMADNATFRARLTREARLAASLNHPGICAVYALEEFDGHLYVVTEFVEGRTLREEIRDGRQPSADSVLTTMRDIAEALGAAHAKGITHRDLKPENVMRSAEGRLKLLDFGLARADDGSSTPAAMAATMPGVLVGTLAYMSPEQINGGPTDRRTDLFALGVLGYEFATGIHPFAAPTPLATVARILEHAPEPLHAHRADLPSAVTQVIDRCLSKNPGERFDTAADAAAALAGQPAARGTAQPGLIWWRLHQLAAVGLYLTGCAAAWQVKEWESSPVARWSFLLVGVFAAVNGVIRGHLLFTDRTDPRRLASERDKTRVLTLTLDLGIAIALFAAATLVSQTRPVAAVLVMGLAAGIATAAVFIEPATTSAALRR